MRKLAIDDKRNYTDVNLVARDFEHGIKALDLMGPWDLLFLDHDLGGEKTGYDILTFINFLSNDEHPVSKPTKIKLVTSNPVGRENMEFALKSMGYVLNIREQVWVLVNVEPEIREDYDKSGIF